ncbi:hypothetical protein SKAU_G00095710 [Synaphobranchus kaupii]|uniref:Uncharacterized protein n=1 Tax=Synaphobranchus kaupii TaxID=118154 RepID=A0A9Q1J6Y9_SYNKA|nr:hypothetical protein SKAU_G00095710 [Synaphobranchus kaupii]
MDLVGPLPRTSRGHCYILVILDYATLYPEAVPLCTSITKAIACEVLQLVNWVGLTKKDPDRLMYPVLFQDIFSTLPGQTALVEHQIRLAPGTVVNMRPYRVPEARRQAIIAEEVQHHRREQQPQSGHSTAIAHSPVQRPLVKELWENYREAFSPHLEELVKTPQPC